jgi:hypothetical protein
VRHLQADALCWRPLGPLQITQWMRCLPQACEATALLDHRF